jgi:hypothetical protein
MKSYSFLNNYFKYSQNCFFKKTRNCDIEMVINKLVSISIGNYEFDLFYWPFHDFHGLKIKSFGKI